MITKILNGNKLRYNINNNIKKNIEKFFFIFKKNPYLAILFINSSNSSNLYVKNKIFFCEYLKIKCILFRSSKSIKFKTLFLLVKILNNDTTINSFFIQKPLPINLNKIILFKFIKITKDVDLLNPISLTNFFLNKKRYIYPCVLQSILSLFNLLKLNDKIYTMSLFGFSNIIGKPIYYNFLFKNFYLNVIDKFDKYNINVVKKSDVIIIGIGTPFFLSEKFVQYGSIIIDVGINYLFDEYLVGDGDLYNLFGKVSWITPVPGGIGPLTVSFLLLNTFKLYLKQNLYLEKFYVRTQ